MRIRFTNEKVEKKFWAALEAAGLEISSDVQTDYEWMGVVQEIEPPPAEKKLWPRGACR